MLSGSLADRSAFWLTETEGALDPAGGPPPSEFEPQELSAKAATDAAASPSFVRVFTVSPSTAPDESSRGVGLRHALLSPGCWERLKGIQEDRCTTHTLRARNGFRGDGGQRAGVTPVGGNQAFRRRLPQRERARIS